MFIYGGNMKKQKIFLKNKQLLGFYLVVGVLFSVISVVAPSISGELVNAVIYRQGDVKVYLFLLVLTYILLLLFSIADQYFFQYFQIKEKNAMRNELFQASLKRGNQEKEQIAAFTSFVNNDVPNIVENYYGGTVDIIMYHHLCCIRTFSDSLAFGGNYFWKQHIDYYDSEYHAWICVEKSKKLRRSTRKI